MCLRAKLSCIEVERIRKMGDGRMKSKIGEGRGCRDGGGTHSAPAELLKSQLRGAPLHRV